MNYNCFPPKGRLAAVARLTPAQGYQILGEVRFFKSLKGSVVEAEVYGLPPYQSGEQPVAPFGFHIHDHSDCGSMAGPKPFEAAGGHFNPDDQPHGNHAGDLPVLFHSGGSALMSVYTDRFTPEEVVGKTVMVHRNPDDYRTQPSGASGGRIACGEIKAVKRRR